MDFSSSHSKSSKKYHLLIIDQNDPNIFAECYLKWEKVLTATYKKCIVEFHKYLIDVFSQFDDESDYESCTWGDVSRKEIEIRKLFPLNETELDLKSDFLNMFDFDTDGEGIHVKCVNKKWCKCFSNRMDEQYLLSYGTSGGLRLSLYAILISENTEMKYKKQPKIEEKKIENNLGDFFEFTSFEDPIKNEEKTTISKEKKPVKPKNSKKKKSNK
jgi:hypothetical protein